MTKLPPDGATAGPVYISTKRATEIIADVAERTGISLDQIVSDSRIAPIAAARRAAYAALREAGASLERIGALMQRDHTTIVSGLRRHAAEWVE